MFYEIIIWSLIALWTFSFVYFVISVVRFLNYKIRVGKLNFKIEEDVMLEDMNYPPAIVGYLVNFQKIGRNEISSTILDLIARNVILLDLEKGFVSDNEGQYKLKLNENHKEKLNQYEKHLINYLFKKKTELNEIDLNGLLYKSNLSKKFFLKFLTLVQKEAKKYDFFDPKMADKKRKSYLFIRNFTRFIAGPAVVSATVIYGIGVAIAAIDPDGIVIETLGSIVAYLIFVIVSSYFVLKAYNLTCYRNYLSENGEKEYSKWVSFKKFLNRYSEIPNHPIMSTLVWDRYYAYSIGLKCGKKFYEQMEKMKIIDNSIDLNHTFVLKNINKKIKIWGIPIRKISIDKHGGSHVDY